MEEFFISDEEVTAYERKNDPARRSVVWSVAAVLAAFVLIGGAYAFGYFGGSSNELTASLFGSGSENGETFPLWSAGREDGVSFANGDGSAPRVSHNAVCGFESGGVPTRGAVLISEVAWMGTENGAQYEWIEIANAGGKAAGIGGWSVVDKDEQIQFVFPKSSSISAGGFLLLARSADRVGSVKADFRYTGNLKNEDEGLRLFNEKCEVMDEVLASPKWPAGESAERLTMERNLATRTWYTSAKAGGTPRAENSTPPLADSERSDISDHPPITPTSSPATTSMTEASDGTDKIDESNVANRSDTVGTGVVAISEVMAGKDGAANWDFVELHNPGTASVNLTGWSVKKKSSNGSESALVTASRLEGKIILAGGYFLLAHPDYAGASAVDVVWPKSYTLAYANNAVVLYNGDGAKVDEVAWTEIPKGQSYAEVNGVWIIGMPTPGISQNQ